MDLMSIAISFVEMLSIFLIYNIFNSKTIFESIGIKVIFAIITSLMYICLYTYFRVDLLIGLIGVLFINSILLAKIDKRDTIIVLTGLVASGIVVLVFELLATLGIQVIVGEKDLDPILYLVLLAIIMLSLVLLLYINFKKVRIDFTKFFSNYKSINIIILNLFIFFLFVKVLMVNELLENMDIIPQVTILTLLLIGINIYFYIYLYKTFNKKKKTEIQKSFNPLLNDLMTKVKANEHEYKNHLNVIYGIAKVSKDEDIRGKIIEYIGEIVSENEEFTRLLHIENTIVKAVLYNKIQRAEKLGVTCLYNVKSNLMNIPVDDAELTVILSNLLNNAIEATSMIKRKEMKIDIEENAQKYIISVSNMTEGVSIEDLNNMFKMGYSTKGEGRGYGLYNVKKIVDKHKGKIYMDLHDDSLSLSIIFEV